MEIGYFFVMFFEDYSEGFMFYKVFFVVNKFIDVFCYCREELLILRGRMYKVFLFCWRIIF